MSGDPYANIGAADPYAGVGVATPDAPPATSHDKPGFISNLLAPGKAALEAVKGDIASAGQHPGSFKGLQDLGALALSPVTGLTNALVVQPGANLLDNIPLAGESAPKLQVGPNGVSLSAPHTFTPEEKHAKNAEIISTALMALGPKGMKGGAVAEGMTSRYAAKVAEAVAKAPAEVALDESGALTDEGREVAAQHGVHPEDLQTAYKAVAEAPPEPAPAPEAAPAAETPAPPPQEAAQPVEAAETPQPTGPLETLPSATPETPAEPAPAEPLPAEAPLSTKERLTQAKSEGVDLTAGQATQDFAAQEKEQTLLGQPSVEGNAARQFFAAQQQQIATAVDRFKSAFGDATATAAERGQQVKDALASLRDSGKAGVTALYENARKIAEGMGDNAQNLIHLDTEPLLAKLRELFIDESVPDQVRNALKQQAAKYGLIGDNPKTVEGQTTVTLRDNTGEPSGKVTFTGPPQRLTILNAEDLRQKINTLYEADTSKQTQALKPVIDDAVQAAVERAASVGTGDLGKAFQDARAGHVAQLQTFKAKDIVQKLIDWKKGTQTPVVLPEAAIRTIFAGGKEAVTNLKRIKALLLSNPTEKSKAAWQAIQAHAVGQVFEDAFVLNANHGGGTMGAISGAKLNSAIARFGVDKLKVLLSESDFNQLMKLRRIIGDATIPIQRTVNHSNTAQKVISFLAQQGMRLASVARFVPGVGPIADTARGLYAVGKEAGEAKRTLAGVRDFTPEAAAKADAPKADPADYAQKFIKVAASDEILAPLVASAANEQRR